MMGIFRKYNLLFAFLLSLVLLIQTFPKSLVVLDYVINIDTYVALCINKDKPGMHCNGTCQMTKKMDEMAHHQNHSAQKDTSIQVVYIFSEKVTTSLNTFVEHRLQTFFYKSKLAPISNINSMLRPPQPLS